MLDSKEKRIEGETEEGAFNSPGPRIIKWQLLLRKASFFINSLSRKSCKLLQWEENTPEIG
jgi:hypothetical protein